MMRNLLRGAGALAAAAVALIAVGCGHRGPPRPPLPRIPRMPVDVAWVQRGDQLWVAGEILGESLTGRRLKAPLRPVLFFFSAPDRSLAMGWDTPSRDREFLRLARRFDLEAVDLPAEDQRLRFERRVPVSRLGPGEAVVLALGVADRRGVSLPSRRRVLFPAREPLPVLRGVRVEPLEDGVALYWEPPPDPRVEAVHVYRAVGAEAGGFVPWKKADAGEGTLVDHEASYGQRLHYALASAARGGEIAVESPLFRPPALDYRDTFPPAAVRDVDAVSERGGVRVLWFPGGSKDEARARVERQAEGSEAWETLGTVAVPDTDFEDRGVEPGRRYRYRVIALDHSGNSAPPAGPTRYVTPRPTDKTP
ncbi:MAG: fibronectin type III domain-containing protein [Acidobacteriota bacterium]|nr:fibronectin type III domain-containing protein [Acidobacteriota bacterium]MDQ7088072.1 fibronectin type III domain-containing protein [Acidobacteriota bacterium]